eukprot:5454092-Amphidinium_carterae.2
MHSNWAEEVVRLLNEAPQPDEAGRWAVCHLCPTHVLQRRCTHCLRHVCTFHGVCYEQYPRSTMAVICRACMERDGIPIQGSLFSAPGGHGPGWLYGW